jgi:hypothetical protein
MGETRNFSITDLDSKRKARAHDLRAGFFLVRLSWPSFWPGAASGGDR